MKITKTTKESTKFVIEMTDHSGKTHRQDFSIVYQNNLKEYVVSVNCDSLSVAELEEMIKKIREVEKQDKRD